MNLSQVVESEIYKSPFISEALHAGIVNNTSLARMLKGTIDKQLREDTSVSAISMAIKRLPLTNMVQLDKSIGKFMKQLGDITVRSDLAEYSFKNSDTLLQCQGQLMTKISDINNYFYSYCRGVNETTIVCSSSLQDDLKSAFDKEQILLTRTNLAAVSITLPPTNLDTYGVYYTILKKLAWKGINIVEVISTSHEISLIISSDDVEEVFSIVLRLKHK